MRIGRVSFVLKNMTRKKTNGLMVVQTGESVNYVKVFKAHTVPQGPCGKLSDALTFLANQQEDGDCLGQN